MNITIILLVLLVTMIAIVITQCVRSERKNDKIESLRESNKDIEAELDAYRILNGEYSGYTTDHNVINNVSKLITRHYQNILNIHDLEPCMIVPEIDLKMVDEIDFQHKKLVNLNTYIVRRDLSRLKVVIPDIDLQDQYIRAIQKLDKKIEEGITKGVLNHDELSYIKWWGSNRNKDFSGFKDINLREWKL